MTTNLHIFDPDLDENWIRDQDNVLEGIIRLGVWQCEMDFIIQFGWGYGTLDTFKSLFKSNSDFLSISNYDVKYRSFDGSTSKQSLSDRTESSFYDDLTFGTVGNPKIPSALSLQPYIDEINLRIAERPDLAYRLISPYRWWTVYRNLGIFTVKYAFGGSLQYGWWTPQGLEWTTYPLAQMTYGWPSQFNIYFPPNLIERSEFSNRWFTYKHSLDWPTVFDQGFKLDQNSDIWQNFYQIGTGYHRFASLENLNNYVVSYRYNEIDNVSFDGDSVIEVTNKLDTRSLLNPIQLDMVCGIESSIFTITDDDDNIISSGLPFRPSFGEGIYIFGKGVVLQSDVVGSRYNGIYHYDGSIRYDGFPDSMDYLTVGDGVTIISIPILSVEHFTSKKEIRFQLPTNLGNGINISDYSLFGKTGTLLSTTTSIAIEKTSDITIEGFWVLNLI